MLLNARLLVTGALALALGSTTGCDPEVSPSAMTESGEVQGMRDPVRGVVEYLGIPFAQVNTRFAIADDATPWDGVRDAFEYGPACPQRADTEVAQSEDCLNLNIWRPLDDGPHPVMVWIHGGGYVLGTGSASVTNGAALAAAGDVVVVSINYRLGALGYLTTAGPGGLQGNYGLQDQFRALEWVRDNIAAFEGDPTNVTIFGESSGGRAVCTLMAVPAADDLFHRAIVQSGDCNSFRPDEPLLGGPSIYERHAGIVADVGCAEAVDVAACLREPERLDALITTASLPILPPLPADEALVIEPVIDGAFLVSSGYDRIASGSRPDIPIITGFTDRESTGLALVMGVWTEEDYQAAAVDLFGAEFGPQFAAVYPSAEFGGPGIAWDTLTTEAFAQCPSLALAEIASQGSQPAYVYDFAHGIALHGTDVPHVFGTVNLAGNTRSVVEAMQAAWAAFAHRGIPSNGIWPSYSAAAPAIAMFRSPLAVVGNVTGDRCEILREIRAAE